MSLAVGFFVGWPLFSQVVTVRFVDGGCLASNGGPGFSGDGTSLVCASSAGGHGPFTTIGEAIQNIGGSTTIQSSSLGDHINVRGAHPAEGGNNTGAFDGTYPEAIYLAPSNLRPTAIPFGKAANCLSGGACVITGCRAADGCAQDETATVRGMTLRSDWVQVGNIWHRTSEQIINPLYRIETDLSGRCSTVGCSDTDPYALYQSNGGGFVPLLYAGDTSGAPTSLAAGSWMYDNTAGIAYVRATGDADPRTTVMYPSYGITAQLSNPTANLTWQFINIEGSRTTIQDWCQSGAPCTNLTLAHYWRRYYKREGTLSQRATGMVVNDVNTEVGGRGISNFGTTAGTYGWRIFHADGISISNSIVQHLGSDGATGNGGFLCPWCDSPWNVTAPCTAGTNCTNLRTTGTAYQLKQTQGATWSNLTVVDVNNAAIHDDCSHDLTITDLTATRTGPCISASNFTPDTSSATAPFGHWSDLTVDGAICTDTGFNFAGGCVITLGGDDALHWDSGSGIPTQTFLARISNVSAIRIGYALICVGTTPGNTVSPPGGMEFDNITGQQVKTLMTGTPRAYGLIVGQASPNHGTGTSNGLNLFNFVTNGLAGHTLVFSGATPSFTGYVDATTLLSTSGGIVIDYSTLGNAAAGFADDLDGATVPFGGGTPSCVGAPASCTTRTFSQFTGHFTSPQQFQHNSSQQDPLLTSTSNNAPQSGSPLRNTGLTIGNAPSNSAWFSDDVVGTPRPQEAGWEQGAFEFCVGGVCGTTSTTVTTTTSSTTLVSTTTSTTTVTTTQPGVFPPNTDVF